MYCKDDHVKQLPFSHASKHINTAVNQVRTSASIRPHRHGHACKQQSSPRNLELARHRNQERTIQAMEDDEEKPSQRITNKEEDEEDDDLVFPGFRFHPTDLELVGFYLKRKVEKKGFRIDIIREIDIYKHDPWDLPSKSEGNPCMNLFFNLGHALYVHGVGVVDRTCR
jgi:hypothetical protein